MKTIKRPLPELDRIPPFVAYALARHNGKRPGLAELVKASGLSERTFVRIARKLSWKDVKTGQMDAFITACNVDILHPWEDLAYLKQTLRYEKPLAHLNPSQKATFMQQLATVSASPEGQS